MSGSVWACAQRVALAVKKNIETQLPLLMCYDSDFGLSEDELSWEEVKEVHAYKGQ